MPLGDDRFLARIERLTAPSPCKRSIAELRLGGTDCVPWVCMLRPNCFFCAALLSFTVPVLPPCLLTVPPTVVTRVKDFTLLSFMSFGTGREPKPAAFGCCGDDVRGPSR
jgi:hypothetical protein